MIREARPPGLTTMMTRQARPAGLAMMIIFKPQYKHEVGPYHTHEVTLPCYKRTTSCLTYALLMFSSTLCHTEETGHPQGLAPLTSHIRKSRVLPCQFPRVVGAGS